MVYTAVPLLCLLFAKLLGQDACDRVSTRLAPHPRPTFLKRSIAELEGGSASTHRCCKPKGQPSKPQAVSARNHASRRCTPHSPTWTPDTRSPFALTNGHSADRQHSLQQTRPHPLSSKEGARIHPTLPRPHLKETPRVSAFGNRHGLRTQGYALSPPTPAPSTHIDTRAR